MRKLLSVLSLGVLAVLTTGCTSEPATVALITDAGTINDGSFNESSWNGVVAYCEENEISYNYYQPVEATDEERWTSVQLAAKNKAEIVVMPGYLFEGIICDAAETYPQIKFLLLDGSYRNDVDTDWGETYGIKYTAEKEAAGAYDNVHCVYYQEEQSGFLAGYAAVQDGYTSLAFMGGMAVPAVVKFGYGFVQGVEAAAVDMNLVDDSIKVEYYYVGEFFATTASNAKVEGWASNGVEVVFSCGGGIWTSVKDAVTSANNLKMIGVDTDQSKDGEFVITSATKGLKDTVYTVLETFFNDKWDDVAGEIDTLGLGDEGDTAYVGLPMDTSKFTTFNNTMYTNLVKNIQKGNYTISNTVTDFETTEAFKTAFNLKKTVVSYTK